MDHPGLMCALLTISGQLGKWIYCVSFVDNLPNILNFMAFWNFLNTGSLGLQNFKNVTFHSWYCFIQLQRILVTIEGHGILLFSSAWLCQQSAWNRNSSVVRPSVCGIDYHWSYCMDFFHILVVASHGPYAQTFFFFFIFEEKKFFFYEYFSFSLTWDPMGAHVNENEKNS